MKSIFIKIALLFVGLGTLQAQIRTDEFKNPPSEYKPVPLWFWNNTTIDDQEAVAQFRLFTQKDGYGGCAILPFGQNFKPEYLSDAYFDLYRKIIQEAERSGLQLSIYDEYGFPSGSMGAINADGTPRFMDKYPDSTIKRLDKIEYTAESGSEFTTKLPAGKIMSLVAMDMTTKQIISLSDNIQQDQIHWTVPQGDWRVLCFVCVKDGDPNVDYLSSEAVKLFVEETHERYYTHFRDDFGSVITQTFFDEPTMYRAQGRMWTDRFNEKFISKYDFSPELLYPALWYDIGAQTQSARNHLFGFRSQLYTEGFMKTIQEWAAKHDILSTGHQDQEEVLNPVSESGDLMRCGKYMDIPGIDKIGGDRPAELFYKIISSSAYNWDKTLVMSETFGAMGNISTDQLYHIAMEQYTKGINQLIPHAVWYNDKDVTFLPELSYRNELYRDALPEFNQFLTRLNYLLRPAGRHVADIAMVYPIQSLQGEHYLDGKEGYYNGGVMIPNTDYIHVSSLLTDSLCKDFTYLHPEVIDEKCEVRGRYLHLNNKRNKERFKVLVVPGMKTISIANLKKIERFNLAGGDVIFTTQLPTQSVDFDGNEVVRSIIENIFNRNTPTAGRAVFIKVPTAAALREALSESLYVYDVEFVQGNELRYIHKICNKESVYYFANLRDASCQSEIQLHGHLKLRAMDPHSGEQYTPSTKLKTVNGTPVTVVSISLNANRSLFLVEEK